MALTNLQMSQLAYGTEFQNRVRAAIFKKSLAIIEDAKANGVNYTSAQVDKAKEIVSNAGSFAGGLAFSTYQLLACSTNVVAGAVSVVNGETVSNISDASLDSQVYTVVFLDLV